MKKFRIREDILNNGTSEFYIESFEPREMSCSSGGREWTMYQDEWGRHGENKCYSTLEQATRAMNETKQMQVKESKYHE